MTGIWFFKGSREWRENKPLPVPLSLEILQFIFLRKWNLNHARTQIIGIAQTQGNSEGNLRLMRRTNYRAPMASGFRELTINSWVSTHADKKETSILTLLPHRIAYQLSPGNRPTPASSIWSTNNSTWIVFKIHYQWISWDFHSFLCHSVTRRTCTIKSMKKMHYHRVLEFSSSIMHGYRFVPDNHSFCIRQMRLNFI